MSKKTTTKEAAPKKMVQIPEAKYNEFRQKFTWALGIVSLVARDIDGCVGEGQDDALAGAEDMFLDCVEILDDRAEVTNG